MSLQHWETRFGNAIAAIPADQRAKPGVLLSIIPERDEWDRFVVDIREAWFRWEWMFTLNPACLVVLYGGVGFFEFRSGAFWDGFAEVVRTPIRVNLQTSINRAFSDAADRFALPVTQGAYVDSGVSQIGIPLSMWDAFLLVCEWALWADGWDRLTDADWHSAVTRRLGGRVRLINFIVKNRRSANEFIREMLDARKVLSSDRNLTLSDIAHASFLRPEYFEEVPETADFLREDDPDSLFSDRARLAWNEDRQTLSLHLPPVDQRSLPARWQLGDLEQTATSTASDFPLNRTAFARALRLQLVAGDTCKKQRISGIDNWALYDDARGRFVNRDRDVLPLSQYTIISQRLLEPKMEGWACDPDDSATDLEFALADGTQIFLTRLFPESRRPRLKIGDGHWIKFAQRRNVALRIFCGDKPANAARFSLLPDGTIRTEALPRPFLEVPLSLVRDDDVPSEFIVLLDGEPAKGRWITFEFDPKDVDPENAETAFCFWRWDNMSISIQ